jgi:hypothetical protein
MQSLASGAGDCRQFRFIAAMIRNLLLERPSRGESS